MKEHPYEFGGMLFAVAIISGIFGGVVGQEMGATDFLLEIDNEVYKTITPPSGSGSGSGGTWLGHNYYEDNKNQQLDCKKSAYSLQEFYDCVNG
tara:strand:+ start:589 stop:870 length:282 start_codon:yes stop_codon:yes gene_type:complete